MTTIVLIAAALLFIAVTAALLTRRTSPGADAGAAPATEGDLPAHLNVQVKAAFFTRSEQALYTALQELLSGSDYRAFPNVRLNDIFTITDPSTRRATYARLRDKHVDFLIVHHARFTPILAIELDGDSHNTRTQQKRDAVKDLAFRSAGLTLLRLDARTTHTPETLYDTLSPHLTGETTP